MKKLFLLLFTFSCLYAVGQVNERATTGFEFFNKYLRLDSWHLCSPCHTGRQYFKQEDIK